MNFFRSYFLDTFIFELVMRYYFYRKFSSAMSSNRNKIKLMIEPSRTISNNLSFSNLLPRKPKAFLIHINGIGFTIQNDQHAAFQFLKNRTIHTDTKFQVMS